MFYDIFCIKGSSKIEQTCAYISIYPILTVCRATITREMDNKLTDQIFSWIRQWPWPKNFKVKQ